MRKLKVLLCLLWAYADAFLTYFFYNFRNMQQAKLFVL